MGVQGWFKFRVVLLLRLASRPRPKTARSSHFDVFPWRCQSSLMEVHRQSSNELVPSVTEARKSCCDFLNVGYSCSRPCAAVVCDIAFIVSMAALREKITFWIFLLPWEISAHRRLEEQAHALEIQPAYWFWPVWKGSAQSHGAAERTRDHAQDMDEAHFQTQALSLGNACSQQVQALQAALADACNKEIHTSVQRWPRAPFATDMSSNGRHGLFWPISSDSSNPSSGRASTTGTKESAQRQPWKISLPARMASSLKRPSGDG